ncbi:hypothetical protein N7450_000021 [Penicillium hetheringtonii]|uniref:Uncharacterized protein n=1 Tax=Penicillium hetheringtonii TaxID=911720 RepID=A0AAD6E1H0_9EURO|nr:hypothetical protein N7450_000021 [Penicillium hetheringtonii]
MREGLLRTSIRMSWGREFSTFVENQDPRERMKQGDRLLCVLDDWYRSLPASYQPVNVTMNANPNTVFPPIWIHPMTHAGAIQMYHFARTAVMLNQPTMGGTWNLHATVKTVCGIANSCQEHEPAMAFVNVQALFAGQSIRNLVVIVTNHFQVGRFVRSSEMRNELLSILSKMLRISGFPAKRLIARLKKDWEE